MRQLKPYQDRLRKVLQDNGIYCERNESLIHDVALAEVMRDNYQDSLRDCGPILRQVGSMGQTKIGINPVYVELRKLLATIISGKAKLGLGNADQVTETTETELDKFIKELEQ